MTGLLKLAQDLLKLGPVHPLRTDTDPRKWGKVPMWNEWPKRALDFEAVNEAPDWESAKATGVARLTGEHAGFFVLDVDPRNGGDETLAALEAEHGELPATRTTMTGGGGLHFEFRWPDFPVTSGAGKLGRGLDVKGNGGYVVGAGSKHSSGAVYAWAPERGPDDVELADAPSWLLDKLRGKETPQVVQPAAPSKEADPATIERAIRYAQTAPPSVSGERGDDVIFDAARGLARGFGLDEQQTFEILRDHYNPRCKPPWPEKRLRHKAHEGVQAYAPLGYLSEPCNPTDTGNAIRFKRRHVETARYCKPLSEWFLQDGKRWTPDARGAVQTLAKEIVFTIVDEAREEKDEARQKRLLAWAMESQSAPHRKSMVDLARAELPISPYELDRDPWLLNVENGTLDLRTGKLRPHRRSDFLTKLAPVAYDPAAKAPRFEKFIEQITGKSPELASYFQRCIGSSLAGVIREEGLFLCYGTGANGKTTLLKTLSTILGDYAVSVQPEILLERRRNAGAASPERVILRSARFALASETDEGAVINSAALKALASTDAIPARQLYGSAFSFDPTHKLFLMTNHRPHLRDTTEGAWRRIHYLPFNVTIPEDERDDNLKVSLLDERAGILSWAVRGCADWQRNGLAPPEQVKAARQEYRETEDELGPFVEEKCDLGAAGEISKGALHQTYLEWATSKGIRFPLKEKDFNARIKCLDGVVEDRKGKDRTRTWCGITFKEKPVKGQDIQAARIAQAEGIEPPETAPKARKRTRRKG